MAVAWHRLHEKVASGFRKQTPLYKYLLESKHMAWLSLTNLSGMTESSSPQTVWEKLHLLSFFLYTSVKSFTVLMRGWTQTESWSLPPKCPIDSHSQISKWRKINDSSERRCWKTQTRGWCVWKDWWTGGSKVWEKKTHHWSWWKLLTTVFAHTGYF